MADLELARRLVGSYGWLRGRMRHAKGLLDAELRVRFTGQFSGAVLARYLYAFPVPPSCVRIRVTRRNWTRRGKGPSYRINGARPAMSLEWYGEQAEALLDHLGWENVFSDERRRRSAYLWRRWRDYREAAKT
jgi:hypothetical protein